jgi:hypothetical protein
MKQKIMFGEWLPDQPGVMGAVTEAKNCYPVTNGYAPIKSEADYSSDADTDLITVFAGKYDSITSLFAASASKVYKFDSSNFSLTALNTTGYSGIESWDITQFGSKMILANGVNKLQSVTLNVTPQPIGDLAASAPVARYVTVVRDFVVAANDGTNTSKVYWSDINDETDWTPAATSQSDFQVIPDGGDITGLAGGEYGLIFLERAIYRMSYTGSPFFFQFDAISRTLGCISNGSITQYGNLTYFLADDGFYVCDGQSTRSIGAEKVNRWFFSNAIPSQIATGMSSTVDPVNKLIYWKFNNIFGSNSILIYSIELNKWSYAETTATAVAFGLTPSATLEQIDIYFFNSSGAKTGTYTQSGTTVTVSVTNHGVETNARIKFDATSGAGVDGTFPITKVDANTFTFTAAASATISTSNCTITFPDIDNPASQIPLDSRVWAGGILLLLGASGRKIIAFSGQPKSASISTGDIDVGRSTVLLVKPIIDAGSGTTSAIVDVASRNNLYEQVIYYATGTMNASIDAENRIGFRSNGDYHRLRLTPEGESWKTAIGLEVDIVKQGDR